MIRNNLFKKDSYMNKGGISRLFHLLKVITIALKADCTALVSSVIKNCWKIQYAFRVTGKSSDISQSGFLPHFSTIRTTASRFTGLLR
jgi:hypothetical protein